MFSSVARWSGQITWHASNPGSIFNRVAFFFSIVVVCLFCLLFLSLDMFSFYSTAGPLFELHERFCDTRCELLGMIRCWHD